MNNPKYNPSTLNQEINITENDVYKKYKSFIIDKKHPCIMANTVFKMNEVSLHLYQHEVASKYNTLKLLNDLEEYIKTYDFDSNNFLTFIAVFPNSPIYSEKEFEKQLWAQLQLLHEHDTEEWDPSVSSNPEDATFSFSINGQSFYIIGMHPQSSRKARQSPYATIVFNLHWQFEKLREMGTYTRVRNRIRKRDRKLQGTINPMLADFGKKSEARQYSGREVDSSWKCPFNPKN